MANRSIRVPSYLTQNRVGTFVFQVRIPDRLLRQLDDLKPLVRFSLRTKDPTEASRRSKRAWLMFDDAVNDYRDPVSFGQSVDKLRSALDGGVYVSPVINVQPSVTTPSPKPVVVHHQSPEAESSDQNDIPLQELVDRFMRHKENTGARAASMKWYGQKVQQFVNIAEVLTDNPSPTLSRMNVELIRNYATVMQRYPRHAMIRRATRDLTEKQRVDMAMNMSRSELQRKGIEPMGFKTIDHNFTAVRELIRYAEKQHYPIPRDLGEIIRVGKRKRGGKPQVKFDQEDLKKLFYSEEYRTGKFDRASDYWMPLCTPSMGVN